MSRDATTLMSGPASPSQAHARPWVLTVAWHPDVDRVGHWRELDEAVEVSRLGPDFCGRPLDDPHLSRKGTRFSLVDGGVRITPHPRGSPVRVDGAALRSATTLPLGAVVELAGRIVLVAHRGAPDDDEMGMIGSGIGEVRERIRQVADLDVPVLIRGETGTGKEHVARAIHARSGRRGAFVAVNLAALNPSTAVADLFGHRRGAFTGADRDRDGLFRAAHGGTLFMDEIGEATPEIQVLLLRALETGEILRVGDDRPVPVDVRLLSATDADLEAATSDGRFRGPLLHRLAGFEVELPPLRDRRQDIGPLMAHFLREELDATGETHRLRLAGPAAAPWFGVDLAASLIRGSWPGNVRQLRNVVRQVVIASRGRPAVVRTRALERALPETAPPTQGGSPDDEDLRAALREADWRPGAAARALGVSKTTLYAWMERTPGVRKAQDLTAADLDGACEAVGPEPSAMARHLEVSHRGLVLRIGALDWRPT